MASTRMIISINPMLRKALENAAMANNCSMSEIVRLALYSQLHESLKGAVVNG